MVNFNYRTRGQNSMLKLNNLKKIVMLIFFSNIDKNLFNQKIDNLRQIIIDKMSHKK